MPDKPNDNKESWISRLTGAYAAYICTMRTTIELPDELHRSAKMAAAERGSTFRELVMQGLRKVLSEAAEKRTPPDYRNFPKGGERLTI